MQSIFLRTSLVLVSILAALGIAELAVRTLSPQMTGEVVFGYHEELGAIAVPNQRGRKTSPRGEGYYFTHNSHGFRDSREFGPEKGAAFRVLFLGDSFVYGVGVNDEQAIPQRVEKILRSRDYSVEIINAGSPGKGTDYELRLLQVLGQRLSPDLIVLCFFWNDYFDNAQGEYFRLGKDERLVSKKPHSFTAKKAKFENLPGINWLLSRFQAANAVRAAMVNLLQPSGQIKASDKKYVPQKVNYELTGIFIKQIIATAQTLGSDILFFYLPDHLEVNYYKKSGETSSYENNFVALLKSQKKKVFSLTPALAAIPGKIELPYWIHYNPRATMQAARYISGPLEEWLKQQQSRAWR